MKHNQREMKRKSVLTLSLKSTKNQNVHLVYDGNILKVLDEDGKEMEIDQKQFSRYRERKSSKGDKTIIDINNANVASLNLRKYIDEYDELYAIDTNTRKINEKYYSVGVLCKFNSEKNIIEITIIVTSENDDIKPEMEQAVWNKVIEFINNIHKKDEKIGLIVDCDLQNIEAYNMRKLKIGNNRYLPENFKLIYASADINDNLFNTMIKNCDVYATKLLDEKQKLICEKIK